MILLGNLLLRKVYFLLRFIGADSFGLSAVLIWVLFVALIIIFSEDMLLIGSVVYSLKRLVLILLPRLAIRIILIVQTVLLLLVLRILCCLHLVGRHSLSRPWSVVHR